MRINNKLIVPLLIIFSLAPVTAFEKPSDFPEGWSLNQAVRSIENIEVRVISGREKAWKGNTFAYVRGHLMSRQFAVTGGDEIEIRFYAKASDANEVSAFLYSYTQKEGRMRYAGNISGFIHKTGHEWSMAEGKITVPEKGVEAVIVVLASDTGAYFDYASVTHIKAGKFSNIEFARNEARGRQKQAG